MARAITPLKDLKVSSHLIPAFQLNPNTSIQNKPVLHYHSVFHDPSASSIEKYLSGVDVVKPQWRSTMYAYSHFHSTTHEVLAIASGRARLCFGHEDNPKRVELEAKPGDLIVVPAGVAHRLLEELEKPFQMVGSYPKGSKQWDMCYGKKGEEDKVEAIKKLDWFKKDLVYGDEGPTLNV